MGGRGWRRAPLACRPARWVRRLVGGAHGEVLAAEIESEFEQRRRIKPWMKRRWALLALWAELSPRLLYFAAERALARRHRAPRTGGTMDSLLFSLRLAARSLRRRPAFTAVVVVTLALGIGANAAIFSVINGVLLQPLPYPEAETLLLVWTGSRSPEAGRGNMSYPDLTDLRDESAAIESLVGISRTTLTLTGEGEPTLLTATRVSAGLLRTFDLAPVLGRDIRDDELGPEAPQVVLISHSLWQQRLGGADDVLGDTLLLNGFPQEIVGVAPPGFDYPGGTQIWYPRRIDLEGCARGCHTWETIGRLATGATFGQAQAEADAIAANLSAAYPDTNLDKRFLVRSLRDEVVGNVRAPLWLLLGAVGAVLVIACANVANLMLARALDRRGEVALIAALGAGPGRLATTWLLESGLLAVLGGIGGLMLAGGSIATLRRLAAGILPRIEQVSIDGGVLLFTLGLSLLVALLSGLSPALLLSRMPLSANIAAAGRGSGMTAGSRRLRAALTAMEVCVSVVLLVAAGLLLRTFVQLHAVELGFETREILRFALALPDSRYAEPEQIRTAFRTLESNLAALPGVESVGSVYGAPLHRNWSAGDVFVEGAPEPEPGRENDAVLRPVGPGYFETMRVPLRAGRLLTAEDDANGRDVAVVNQAFVRENFPDGNVIGRRALVTVSFGFYEARYWEIVGVVGDVRSEALTRIPRPAMYVPHGRTGNPYLLIHVRGVAGVRNLMGPIRAEVAALDPDLPLQDIETISEAVAREVAPTRFVLAGVGVFAATALLLAAVGLYGVTAYLVSHRAREIGIRVALGARRAQIMRMVVADGLRPAVLGLLAGLALVFAGSRVIDSLLFNVAARDPLVLTAVPAVLLAVTIVAIVVPVLRASRIDPLRTLRSE